MGLANIIDWIISKLSSNRYQCHYCHKWFDLRIRCGDLTTKLPKEARFEEYGDFLNYCSDKCCKEDDSVTKLEKGFTDGIHYD